MVEWLSAPRFGQIAGITRRAAMSALARAAQGQPWRGSHLETRQVYGRGGKSGLSYQVSLRSLSEALERPLVEAWETSPLSIAPERKPAFRPMASRQDARLGELLAVIPEVHATETGSKARGTAVKAAAARLGVDARTVQRMVVAYDFHGPTGLGRKKPSDAGEPRVLVSRQFDAAYRAAGYDESGLAELGRWVPGEIKGTWVHGGDIKTAKVARTVEQSLKEECRKRGYDLAAAALRIPHSRVKQFIGHRVADTYRNDRRKYHDSRPWQPRLWTCYPPMECVFGDVHPTDVRLIRPDGSETWAKLIAWFDASTRRVFHHLVQLPKGEGVRQEHIIEAFLAMADDPAWGLPKTLYLDNGSEYLCMDAVTPILSTLNGMGHRDIIRAIPYNARAKPIEPIFKHIEQECFSHLPGYAGGDRLNKRTQTVGRAPVPYDGSFEAFKAEFTALMRGFHAKPVGGQWNNRSANDWFGDHVEDGWAATVPDRAMMDVAFSKRHRRQLRNGNRIAFGGVAWTLPGDMAFESGITVQIAECWRRGAPLLADLPGCGWTYLERETALPALWEEGAKASARRQKNQNARVRHLEAEAHPVDVRGLLLRAADEARPVVPNRPNRIIGGGSQVAELADAKARANEQSAAMISEAERRRRRDAAETARLEALDREHREVRRAS